MLLFVRPDHVRLPLSDGQWIEVKRRLNYGETRKLYTRLYRRRSDGALETDPFENGIAQILAYLVDWSAVDHEGRPIAIRGASVDDLQRIVDSLDMESAAEIRTAIETHEVAMIEARAQEKKRLAGMTGGAVISFSPSAAAGASSGSAS